MFASLATWRLRSWLRRWLRPMLSCDGRGGSRRRWESAQSGSDEASITVDRSMSYTHQILKMLYVNITLFTLSVRKTGTNTRVNVFASWFWHPQNYFTDKKKQLYSYFNIHVKLTSQLVSVFYNYLNCFLGLWQCSCIMRRKLTKTHSASVKFLEREQKTPAAQLFTQLLQGF